ncbi:hypothetical protein [Ruegeria profundi]|uniref:hypothetical protein n=1 Tax=Ruegeria profundi TaxID=1685378 RepID=UPI001CD74302|nr:hypothetical protein [Ruegeria profundi]MCA0928806.1 hypothetical protein [Ruegeria profundi]
MFEIKLERSGYHLRPVVMADVDAIAENLFLFINVAKTLMHNVSTPSKTHECAEGWCSFFAIDWTDQDHFAPDLGLWAKHHTCNQDCAECMFNWSVSAGLSP